MTEVRLQLFSGKGGVGKSTLVAAAALHAAEVGKRPLIVELGHRATMAGIFGREDVGHQPVHVGLGVHACNIQPGPALEAYARRQLRVKGLARVLTGSDALAKLLDAAPGVVEVLTLTTLRQLVEAKPAFDPVLVDLDATGHALMLLELPRVLDELIGPGRFRRALFSSVDLLEDPERCRLNLVTVPEPMVVNETLELIGRLRAEHGVPLGVLVMNRIPPTPVADATRRALPALTRLAHADGDEVLLDDLAVAERELELHDLRQTEIRRARDKSGLPVVELPRTEDVSLDGLTRLGRLFSEAAR